MTLQKLAELSGVSVGTVSKAFSGSDEISKETREKIFQIAREQNCFDKYYKAPRERPLIALMFPEPESEFYANNIGIFEHELRDRGADVIIAFTRFEPEMEARMFRELAYGMRVDGVIMSGAGRLIRNADELPLVAISSYKDPKNHADTVKVDFDGGIYALAQTVKTYGHRKVGFIGERLTAQKEEKLRDALRSVGLPVRDEYIAEVDGRFEEAGKNGMKELIGRGELPSVIITAYDRIAYGAIKYAKECGYSIPDDVSFVGMDDISSTTYFDIPLSSLHVDFDKACPEIVDLIFKRIKNRHYRSRTEIVVPVTVKIRESLKNISEV